MKSTKILLAVTLINLFLLQLVADAHIINMFIAAVFLIICIISIMLSRYRNKMKFILTILSMIINLFVIFVGYHWL